MFELYTPAPTTAAPTATSAFAGKPRTPRYRLPSGDRPVRSAAPAPAGTTAYRDAVRAFDTTHPMRPAMAGIATSVAEVQAALAIARDKGLGLRMHSTGHGASRQADMSHDLLLKVRVDEPITVDQRRATVRIPAGAAWGSVVPELARYGLAAPHGSSAHVGAIGYLMAGGLSAYARSTGVAANSIESVEMVLADGRHVKIDAAHDPELFWAVRGGGGGLGVVTAVTVRAFAPGQVVTGAAFWRLDDAPAVADAWAQWSRTAPSTITTSIRVMSLLPVPGVPAKLFGRRLLVVSGTAVDHGPATGNAPGAFDATEGLLGRLTAAAAPVFDSWQPADVLEVPHTHMDPPIGAAHVSDHMLLDDRAVPGASTTVGTWLDLATNGPARKLAMVELRQLGGALADAPANGGAVASLAGRFGYFAVGARLPWRGDTKNLAALDATRAALAGYDTGRTAPTFAADRQRPQRSFGDVSAMRAAAVRAAVDPAGVFAADVALGAITAPVVRKDVTAGM
jgi:hypothetical protein